MKPEPPVKSDCSVQSARFRLRLRPSGGYRKLASFQTAALMYDATWWFCEKFLCARAPWTIRASPRATDARTSPNPPQRAAGYPDCKGIVEV